jgi:esterase
MKLFYRSFGSGPELIILHGLYGSSDNWVSIAKKLSAGFRVILPDLRNHGQSLHNTEHTYESMCEDLIELASDLNIEKFFLAGHSMGGKVAITFSLKYPSMLNGLLIADISPFINESEKTNITSEHNYILSTILSVNPSVIKSRQEMENLLSEKISSDKIRGFILKNLQRDDGNRFSWKLNAEALLQNLDNIMEGIDSETWVAQQITGFPVIFLRGEKSAYIPDSHFAMISRVFPAVQFFTIKNAGHWIHADAPDEVVSYLKKLLPED